MRSPPNLTVAFVPPTHAASARCISGAGSSRFAPLLIRWCTTIAGYAAPRVFIYRLLSAGYVSDHIPLIHAPCRSAPRSAPAVPVPNPSHAAPLPRHVLFASRAAQLTVSSSPQHLVVQLGPVDTSGSQPGRWVVPPGRALSSALDILYRTTLAAAFNAAANPPLDASIARENVVRHTSALLELCLARRYRVASPVATRKYAQAATMVKVGKLLVFVYLLMYTK